MTPRTWSTDIASHENSTSHHVTPAAAYGAGSMPGDGADALAPYTEGRATDRTVADGIGEKMSRTR
ncbi:MAG TPA: hypothetical protein VII16_16255 [Actinomycetes bacterium]|jgi:hypothetical protein